MKQRSEYRLTFETLWRDEHGVAAIILTVYLPVILGLFALAIDMSYALWTRNMLQVTAESAALAATAQLPNNNTCSSDPNSACAVSVAYAQKNMPSTTYGNVLNGPADTVVGTWNCSGSGSASCFVPVATGTICTSNSNCNAVRVTTRRAQANNNPLPFYFALLVPALTGQGSFDISATAIGVFGNPGAGNPTWSMAIVQDISGSFTYDPTFYNGCYNGGYPAGPNCGIGHQGALPLAIAADQALLNCMAANASAGSLFSIAPFTGTAQSYQPPISVSDRLNTLRAAINGIPQCALPASPVTATPRCQTGTDIAAGINTTITQYSNLSPGPAGSQRSMVIVTDGMPNACNGSSCSIATAEQNALNAARAAGCGGNCATPDPTKAFNVSTIYYCSDITCSTPVDVAAANWLATLVQGTGIALKKPAATELSALTQQICGTMQHRLVW